MPQIKTPAQAESARRRAITALHNFGRDDDANRIADLSAQEYAKEKGFLIAPENANPYRRITTVPRRTKDIITELETQVEDLEAENSELQGRLDQAADVLAGADEDEEGEDDDDEGEDEDRD